jgi:hypothetical protein
MAVLWMRGRLGGHGSPRLDAAALMTGRGKLRWVNIDCRHCGHGTVAELVRKHDLERRLKCSRCGKRGPVLR